jgi:23S rRNA (adenine1618-N6)-methyltransferase
MDSEKHKNESKSRLHLRNKNKERYDLNALIEAMPSLSDFIVPNRYGENSIEFSNPLAVKTLNKAILKHYYGIDNWDFPDKNLCPPIPGRADYIHHVADILAQNNFGKNPTGNKINCLDIGTGASCIYPIIGSTEYDWNFIGSDISSESIESANTIINSNPSISKNIVCRLQKDSENIFTDIIEKEEKFDISICNPPFHSSVEDAQKGSHRKVKNVLKKETNIVELNFSGISDELVYPGGEYQFIEKMVKESNKYSKNVLWFSTLVSKQSNLKGIYILLQRYGVNQVKTIPMGTGNKSSRVVAWSFFSRCQQAQWREDRWK